MAQIDPEGIRARIRQARKEAGFTQQALADLIDRHKRTVENYENVRVPDWSELVKIGRVLDRPIDWFLYGDREDEPELVDRLDELIERVDRIERLVRLIAPADALEALRAELQAVASEAVEAEEHLDLLEHERVARHAQGTG